MHLAQALPLTDVEILRPGVGLGYVVRVLGVDIELDVTLGLLPRLVNLGLLARNKATDMHK